MKKVLLMGAFVVFGAMAMTSCKKDYKCDYPESSIYEDATFTGLNKASAETQELACSASGGSWSKN